MKRVVASAMCDSGKQGIEYKVQDKSPCYLLKLHAQDFSTVNRDSKRLL